MKSTKDKKVVQVILKDKELIEKFEKFVKNQNRSESNAGEMIFKEFFKNIGK